MTIRTKAADALAYLERKARGNMEEKTPDELVEEQASNQPQELPKPLPAHDHKWKRGILPGQKYIKTCAVNGCGATENVSLEKWQQIG